MAFWLASRRRGQETSWIQRFDPRFWTVDFPRPALASVVTTGPDSMRVDCEFHHAGELVGLIWDSEDKWDHPLLAYETRRNYAHTALRFRWQSTGLIALDQANGPTLTIEGRDASGNARTWYVRLWNYATGSPTDAQIELRFSDLEGGWFLPGDKVHPSAIDRMFISLVPPGYVSGSEVPLASRANGSVTISGISCDGAHSMLETGDVLTPTHGVRIATAYDDAYNQTPARLVRSAIGLGYRDEILHYVGMSHFMRLAAVGGLVEVVAPAVISSPAEQWHRSFFGHCRDNEFEVIASLSYELFDEYCPADWKQRTHDGEAALTGWVPPSTLLSPAQAEAMQWLQQAATAFVLLQEQAGLPVRFQIGEPWWWVAADGRPCLYDEAAMTAFGGSPAVITDMRAPLSSAQTALLDHAGTLLAQSTASVAQAVREAATGGAEVLLLAFTPTILDPQMPELHRANLPSGWAYPAFDRLQLEDYDWVTAGADAARRNAYAQVDQRLGYPIAAQDYLSGFVLRAEDSEALWPRIDAALDEAEARGVSRRFVWALPQISRDGYVRLPSFEQDDDMQAFDDVLYPFALGRDASASPEFSTSVVVTASGHERRNSLWSDARMHFDAGPGIRSEDELAELLAFFRARRGAARGFRFTDPFDFSSSGMIGTPSATDQLIGMGDGLKADFQLVKRYGDGEEPQVRPISRPKAETIIVSVNGVIESDWSLEANGRVRLASAPPEGAEVRAGFLFDVPVRFAEDRLDVSAVNFAAGDAPSVPMVEIREVE
ncbi:DUF2460 domain-containing protein [Altererythrobacter arenosus]|uniref:DUF2460 domain-containing protein n=1 Tax=Altererythrobacter arenosus TaxID=3032592 RepID=A0ABY8FX77_9SPHN|nr:DUF2460 domain-containing protein [Altererythrobacter sp. CAU 1644]WFL78835.1 DUF2460 domain-containing protein [Altererythrobacter sp. CAU 1644]